MTARCKKKLNGHFLSTWKGRRGSSKNPAVPVYECGSEGGLCIEIETDLMHECVAGQL
jgi:hypothetical protein